jgi:antitoxin component YwqK of YwqJK toxin-antitoxin module
VVRPRSLREKTNVYVAGHIDGCDIKRVDVTEGAYYSPDGTEIGRVDDGTGNIKYLQPNGNPIQEYVLKSGQLAVERHWYKNGTLQSERNYLDGKLHGECSDYFPDGRLRSKSTYEQNASVDAIWYDQNGNVLKKLGRD